MTLQVLATMSPTASQQFGKVASIAVIMTLLPYIYSAISIKVLAYRQLPPNQYALYTIIGLCAAIYSMAALVGSDGEQTRWSLIFVIATIVFYSAAITRKREIEEKHIHPGGISPQWVRYAALIITIAALAATFWMTMGRHEGLFLHRRATLPGLLKPAATEPAKQQPAPRGHRRADADFREAAIARADAVEQSAPHFREWSGRFGMFNAALPWPLPRNHTGCRASKEK